MKKNQKKKKKVMIQIATSLPGIQILVPRTIGSAPNLFHRKLRQTIPLILFLVPRLRLQGRMPLSVRAWFGRVRRVPLVGARPSGKTEGTATCSLATRSLPSVETRLLFRSQPISDPSVEQDVPLDFLQDLWWGIKDIPQICTARGGKR